MLNLLIFLLIYASFNFKDTKPSFFFVVIVSVTCLPVSFITYFPYIEETSQSIVAYSKLREKTP